MEIFLQIENERDIDTLTVLRCAVFFEQNLRSFIIKFLKSQHLLTLCYCTADDILESSMHGFWTATASLKSWTRAFNIN